MIAIDHKYWKEVMKGLVTYTAHCQLLLRSLKFVLPYSPALSLIFEIGQIVLICSAELCE